MKNKITITLLIVLLLPLILTSGRVQADEKEINFGYVQWPGVTVKTEVVAQIAERLGYQTKLISGSQSIVFKGMDTGDLDVFLGNWLPTMKIQFEKYQAKGSVQNVRINLAEVAYRTAVPEYVYQAGVKSLSDLDKYADKFDQRIYGIEPGNEGNLIIQQAIDNNKYNLKDWTLQASSTAGMLSAVKRAINNQEWIAFNGWKPHYMNLLFEIKYLDDPEHIWGEGESVHTVIRTGFAEENPNFYKFLEQFKVTADIQNHWINSYKREGKSPDQVAKEWLAANPDLVSSWLKGVKTTSGQPAQEILKSN